MMFDPNQPPPVGLVVLDPDATRYAAAFGHVRRFRVSRCWQNQDGDWLVGLVNDRIPGREHRHTAPDFWAKWPPPDTAEGYPIGAIG